MRVYLVRHGETVANAARIMQGWSEYPLNERGRELARITGDALKDVRFDAAFSSPLSRAFETAQLILSRNRNEIPEIRTDIRIREMGFGRWEGQNWSDIPADRLRLLHQDPRNYVPTAGGETIPELLARTASFWDEMTARVELQDATVLVVSHGRASRAMLNRFYEDRLDYWQGKVPPNCGVNIVDIGNGEQRLVERDRVFY